MWIIWWLGKGSWGKYMTWRMTYRWHCAEGRAVWSFLLFLACVGWCSVQFSACIHGSLLCRKSGSPFQTSKPFLILLVPIACRTLWIAVVPALRTRVPTTNKVANGAKFLLLRFQRFSVRSVSTFPLVRFQCFEVINGSFTTFPIVPRFTAPKSPLLRLQRFNVYNVF